MSLDSPTLERYLSDVTDRLDLLDEFCEEVDEMLNCDSDTPPSKIPYDEIDQVRALLLRIQDERRTRENYALFREETHG
tara:strand:- start:371 stop:607 length:237 start_codon:yes stop_codon:yes gene_type:complete